MIMLGISLLVLGFVFAVHVLWFIGIVLLVIGAVLWMMGATDHGLLGRRHYY